MKICGLLVHGCIWSWKRCSGIFGTIYTCPFMTVAENPTLRRWTYTCVLVAVHRPSCGCTWLYLHKCSHFIYWAPTQNLHGRFMYITQNQASFWAEILQVEVSNHFSDPPKSCPMDQTCQCGPFWSCEPCSSCMLPGRSLPSSVVHVYAIHFRTRPA